MSYEDLPDVHVMEKNCFTTPWDMSSFKYELMHKSSILKVAVFGSRIISYVCIRTILDITYVLNLVVIPEFRRMGIGTRLLRDGLKELTALRPDTVLILLEVRESNTPAIKLYENFGFKTIGKRTEYYHKPNEDAVIMELKTGKKL